MREASRGSRSALIVLALAGALLLATASTAEAKQVYDYTYAGDYIDGSGSEKGTFPQFGLAGIAYDGAKEDVLATVGATPGYLSRFTKAGAPDPFDPPSLGETLVLARALGNEANLAVDESGGPGAGNVYVASGGSGYIYGFAPDGAPLPGFNDLGSEQLCGIDVSPQGEVWVSAGAYGLIHLNTAGQQVGPGLAIGEGGLRPCHAVRDGAGSFYAVVSGGKAVKLDASGNYLYDLSQSSEAHGFALDDSNDDVFSLEGNTVGYYDSVGAKLGSFGAPDPGHSFEGLFANPRGIAVDPVSHDVWVANRRSYGGVAHIERFERSAPITVPTATTAGADYAGKEATLHGTLDPDGIQTSDCHFDWVTIGQSLV